MKKRFWALTLIPSLGFLIGVTFTNCTAAKFKKPASSGKSSSDSWVQQVENRMKEPKAKTRVTIPQTETPAPSETPENSASTAPAADTEESTPAVARKIASTAGVTSVSNGKTNFSLKGFEIVNIEKDKTRERKNRLKVTNMKTGKASYLSGELVLVTEEIANLPSEFEGITLKVARALGNNRYIVEVDPPTEVPRAIEKIQSTLPVKSIKVDVVDREIRPR